MFPHGPFGGPPEQPDRMPTEPEQVEGAEEHPIDDFLYDPVLRWRAKDLARHGMNPRQARALALDRRVDVHDVVERLLKKGCDPALAFDIASF